MEFNISKKDKIYRELISRDYKKFHIGDFCKAIEARIEYRDNLEVNIRAEKFVQSIVNALDTVAPKKIFKIRRI